MRIVAKIYIEGKEGFLVVMLFYRTSLTAGYESDTTHQKGGNGPEATTQPVSTTPMSTVHGVHKHCIPMEAESLATTIPPPEAHQAMTTNLKAFPKTTSALLTIN